MTLKTRLLVILGLVALFSICALAQTANPQPAGQTAAVTDQQKTAIQTAAGIAADAATKVAGGPAAAKTWPEFADKALEGLRSGVTQMAAQIEAVAPQVWRIMVRQQYAKAAGELAGPFLALLLIGTYVLVVKKVWKKWDGYENDPYFDRDSDPTAKFFRGLLTTTIPGILGLIFGGILAEKIGTMLPLVVNPEYYAIRDLVELAGKVVGK